MAPGAPSTNGNGNGAPPPTAAPPAGKKTVAKTRAEAAATRK